MSIAGAGFKVAELAFGASLLEQFISVEGVEDVSGQLFALIPKIALKSASADHAAMRDMLELMRSRVPRDTGALYNGITGWWEGSVGVVEASAQRTSPAGKLSADYARFVEFGTKPHAVADGDFFDGDGSHRPSRAKGGHPGTPAEPFFFGSAFEVLEKRHGHVLDATNEAIAATGMGD